MKKEDDITNKKESYILNKIIDWTCVDTGVTRKKGVVYCNGTHIQQNVSGERKNPHLHLGVSKIR